MTKMGDAWKRAQMSARDLDRKHNNNETKKNQIYMYNIYAEYITRQESSKSGDRRFEKGI